MIWKVENYQGTRIWYSSDVIKKIKERLKDEHSSTAFDVMQIIKESEKSETGNCMV